MIGTTSTVQQPVRAGAVVAALASAVAIVAAATAIAWGSANVGRATQPVAAPAAIYAPAARDLGARDQSTVVKGLSLGPAVDHGSSAQSSTGSAPVPAFNGSTNAGLRAQ